MNKCETCIWANKVNEQLLHCNYVRCVKEDGWIADIKRKANEPLPDKFFVKTKEEEVLLVTKEDDSWWIEEDYTHDDYDSNFDTSGTMSHDILLANLKNKEYTRIPDDEGWVTIERCGADDN